MCQVNSRPVWLDHSVALCLLCNRGALLVVRSQDLILLGLGCGSSAHGPDVVELLDHPVIQLGLRLGLLSDSGILDKGSRLNASALAFVVPAL